ncbi:MAG TPA: sulfotransferase [Caulobacteraceae bacterium]|nr:sulfotransferase [Caulobacteraceae bacterium]
MTDLVGAAMALRREGRFAEASQALQRAVNLAPDDPTPWAALIDCELAARRPEVALQVADAALRRLPGNPALLAAKARVLQNDSRIEEAETLFREALASDPASREARFGLASLAVEAGDWDEAETLAAPLLPAGTGGGAGWLGARIALGRGDFEAARVRAAAALSAPGLTPEQESEITLLLGEALDGLGRPAEAFGVFAQGKAILHRLYAARAASREGESAKYQRLAAWFEAADPAPWRSAAPPTASTGGVRGHAFLVGFPRSGTTLLEQALAGHPGLAALEEAPTLAGAYDARMTSPEGLERLASLSGDEAETWRAAYWAEVARAGVLPSGKVFLDKAPAGTLYLPLIAKLFPDARILFAIRDPRDVTLSCFRNHFQMNALTYAFTDLVEAARCYAASMQMAQVYRRLLPLDVAEVRYEALVADFEGELGRIAAFLALDLRPTMLDVAATADRRIVRTPSAPQVRAGLNARGIGRWRAYEAELTPVLPTLAPWVERFGY